MKLDDRLDTIECRRDEKARRVSNVAPDTTANVTAEQLENGVSLESLEALNVPVLRYATQVTIHGKLPPFDAGARPGGYKAVFQNANGSIGVRYSAIDAEKKAILQRAFRANESKGWVVSANSTGFSLYLSFYVRDETKREEMKQNTLAAMRAVPASLFYGGVGAFSLPYGLGYAVEVYIGAIPVENLWQLVNYFFGITNEQDLLAHEEAKKAKHDASMAVWRAEQDKRAAERLAQIETKRAELAAFLANVKGERLSVAPRNAGAAFLRYRIDKVNEAGEFIPVRIELAKRGATLCYSVDGGSKWGAVQKPYLTSAFVKWDEAAKRGELLAIPSDKPIKAAKVAGDAKDQNAPASSRQTFALYCATGKDWRAKNLTYGQAHAALASVQHLRGDKPAALAIVEKLFA